MSERTPQTSDTQNFRSSVIQIRLTKTCMEPPSSSPSFSGISVRIPDRTNISRRPVLSQRSGSGRTPRFRSVCASAAILVDRLRHLPFQQLPVHHLKITSSHGHILDVKRLCNCLFHRFNSVLFQNESFSIKIHLIPSLSQIP